MVSVGTVPGAEVSEVSEVSHKNSARSDTSARFLARARTGG